MREDMGSRKYICTTVPARPEVKALLGMNGPRKKRAAGRRKVKIDFG